MRKAAIIGGSQIIGSYIIFKFLAENYNVKVQISQKSPIKKDPSFINFSNNKNLEVHETDLISPEQIQKFIEDCEIIIHCGDPMRLDIKSSEIPIYAPVIKRTGNLFKAIAKSKSLRKVIFITSAVAFNTDYTSTLTGDEKNDVITKNMQVEKAKYHAAKVVYNVIDSFPKSLFEVIFISPVEVKNHQLSSSSISTATGLQFLFRKRIMPDPFFQEILKRQVINGLTNIEELPEKVFNAAALGEMDEALISKNERMTVKYNKIGVAS